MSDCAYACIAIGGHISSEQAEKLAELIGFEGLCNELDDTPFSFETHVAGEPLRLHDYNARYGMFEALEQYCCNEHIPYLRWCGTCPGAFEAERIVFDGISGPLNYATDDDDHVMLHVQTIIELGSMRAIRAYLKPADFEVPLLVVATGTPTSLDT